MEFLQTYGLSIYFLIHLALSFCVAQFGGDKREIGFGTSLLISFLFTPFIGSMITGLSPVKITK
jgi:hypothetical protein